MLIKDKKKIEKFNYIYCIKIMIFFDYIINYIFHINK